MFDFEKALEFTAKKHAGQKRKGGEDYIVHPYAVSQILKERGFDKEYIFAGLFHDLLEDTDATEEEILALSNYDVLEAVKILTKTDGYVMDEYITNVFRNKIASVVKQVDRLDNLRSGVACEKDWKIKYVKETEKYYYPLIRGREFEDEIIEATNVLAHSVD